MIAEFGLKFRDDLEINNKKVNYCSSITFSAASLKFEIPLAGIPWLSKGMIELNFKKPLAVSGMMYST